MVAELEGVGWSPPPNTTATPSAFLQPCLFDTCLSPEDCKYVHPIAGQQENPCGTRAKPATYCSAIAACNAQSQTQNAPFKALF